MRAPLLFESDYFVFAVKADDGTERVYQVIVNRGGTASLQLVSEQRGRPAAASAP